MRWLVISPQFQPHSMVGQSVGNQYKIPQRRLDSWLVITAANSLAGWLVGCLLMHPQAALLIESDWWGCIGHGRWLGSACCQIASHSQDLQQKAPITLLFDRKTDKKTNESYYGWQMQVMLVLSSSPSSDRPIKRWPDTRGLTYKEGYLSRTILNWT